MIGLFDSGIGGTTVLRHIQMLLPTTDLLYLADQAHCPYGPRSLAELRTLSEMNARWLQAQGAELIVVACNTASAAALHWLRHTIPELPFVGMVPAVKPAVASSRSGVVGVLATPATIHGELLDAVVLRWAGATRVVRQGCPGLAEQIETGELDAPATIALLQQYLQPLLAAGADTIVLGCTHYPFLIPQMQRLIGSEIALVDAAPAVARQTARVWAEHIHPPTEGTGNITYATTGDCGHFTLLLDQLGLPTGKVIAVTDLHAPSYAQDTQL